MPELLEASSRPQTRRYERKRGEILDAAARLFNARGLGGVTISDVATEVGLTTTSVTYYYRRKEELAGACLFRAIHLLEEFVPDPEPAPGDGDRPPISLLFARYLGHLAEIEAGTQPHLINFWDLRALTGPQALPLANGFVQLFRRVRHLIAGTSLLPFDRAQQNARTHLLLTAVIRSKGWVLRFEPEDYARAAARAADILTGGLAAPGRVWAPIPLDLDDPGAHEPGQVSREAFLRAATDLVNAHGYRGASVDRISAALNVTKGSFYHHNETKDGLVAECFSRSFELIRRAHRAARALPGDGWTRLSSMMAAIVRHQQLPGGPLLRLSALSAVNESIRPSLLADLAKLDEKITALISDGIADGSIRPVDPVIAGHLVTGMINAAGELATWAPTADPINAADLFVRPLMRGILKP